MEFYLKPLNQIKLELVSNLLKQLSSCTMNWGNKDTIRLFRTVAVGNSVHGLQILSTLGSTLVPPEALSVGSSNKLGLGFASPWCLSLETPELNPKVSVTRLVLAGLSPSDPN
jgi:hypothetical protein